MYREMMAQGPSVFFMPGSKEYKMKKLLNLICFGLITIMALAQTATAENIQLKAVSLLEAGEPQEAYTLLTENVDKASKDPQEWFLLAMSAKESGRPAEEVINYLKKVIALDPRAGRPKLELAQILRGQGKNEEAKKYYMEVRALNPPKAVGDNIDAYIAAIDREVRSWHLRTSLSWIYDTNANAGPAIDSVLMFGLPFELSEDAKKTEDTGYKLGLGIDHFKKITDRVSWQSGLSLNYIDYHKVDSLDSTHISLSTGPTWRMGKKTVGSAPVIYDWLRVGHQRSYYYYLFGIAPQLRYYLSYNMYLGMTGTYSEKKYKDQGNRDLDKWSVEPFFNLPVGKRGNFRFGVTGGRENSGIDSYSNRLLSGNVGYSHIFGKYLSARFFYSYIDTKYDEKEPAYTEVRHDKTNYVSATLDYPIKVINSNLMLTVDYTDTASSLEMYTYDRSQVFITLQTTF